MPLPEPESGGRRAFLRGSAQFLLSRFGGGAAAAGKIDPAVRFGLFTDLHHADKPPNGTRHYREAASRLRAAVRHFKSAKADFAAELGDFIDEAGTPAGEARNLKTIEAEFRRFGGTCHHVLGNHCVWTLEKRDFLEICGVRSSYYSFDSHGIHFVVLDACFRKDGVPYGGRNFDWKDSDIPEAERAWLARDLGANPRPAIVFVHQRLDAPPPYGIAGGVELRRILERAGKTVAVFQGHHHRNSYNEINGIHYCTLNAMVEGPGEQNGAYCMVQADPAGNLQVEGFRNQQSYAFQRPAAVPSGEKTNSRLGSSSGSR